MNLVLLGPAGSGKGTQAGRMAQQLGIPGISSGEILREVAQQGGEQGRLVDDLINQGRMVPDELIQALIWQRLDQPDAREGFILDGFPRTIQQAEALDQFLAQRGQALTVALDLEVDEDELIRRLSGRRVCPLCQRSYHLVSRPPREPDRCDVDGAELEQRADDFPEAIRQRLALYHQRTEPVLEYYRGHDLLYRITANRPVEDVSRQIQAALEAASAMSPGQGTSGAGGGPSASGGEGARRFPAGGSGDGVRLGPIAS
jgi:adenylate kinase